MRGDTLGKAEILTPRLRLRRFSMQDMSGFLLFAADADTMLRAGSKPVSTPAEAESELRRAADDPYAFAITLRETGEVMGKIKYQRDYCRYNTDSISIGYELSRRYRHNGYMTEALRAMVQNAFEVMNVEVVAISHFVGNEPSRKVIERAGFIFEGVMPCGFKRFDGEFLTMCVTPSCVRSTIRGSFRPCDACGKAYKSMCMPIFRQKIVEIPLFSIANVQKQC